MIVKIETKKGKTITLHGVQTANDIVMWNDTILKIYYDDGCYALHIDEMSSMDIKGLKHEPPE